MTDAPAPIPASGHRRRLRIGVALAGVLALGAAAAWQVTARSYGLEHGSLGGASPGGTRYVAADAAELRYPLQPGATHTITYSVRNPGPLPVRITALPDESLIYDIDRISAVEAAAAERFGCFCEDAAGAFQPVDLDAGAELLVFVHIRLEQRPWEACGRAWFKSFPVRYSVLGLARQQRVPLDAAIGFQAPGPDCTAEGSSWASED